jgi:hypothetical protein
VHDCHIGDAWVHDCHIGDVWVHDCHIGDIWVLYSKSSGGLIHYGGRFTI